MRLPVTLTTTSYAHAFRISLAIQRFACGFLQNPPRAAHPCGPLAVPLIQPAKILHLLGLRPAPRIKKKARQGRLFFRRANDDAEYERLLHFERHTAAVFLRSMVSDLAYWKSRVG
jgi:hypothetical protein